MEFESIVRRINSIMAEEGVRSREIGEIIAEGIGSPINCYPGEPGYGCHSIAFFVSLKSKRHAVGQGHLTFRQAIERFVQHMQGHCAGHTSAAVIITDQWDPDAYNEWSSNILEVKKHSLVEAYVITGRTVNQMRI